MKLGSLFDGSGGFPLAARINNVEPVWASEIEQFPIDVTKKNFPNMKHIGNIVNVKGFDIEPVDIITFGSPCQNLSVAGNRLGLSGSQSSLFFEAIRVVREMREATNNIYPRFLIWENVVGALSSNNGDDFYQVIKSFVEITDDVSIPKPKKWMSSGFLVSDNSSLAWRVLNSKFFGVAQKRRRVFVVVDFAAERADSILFE